MGPTVGAGYIRIFKLANQSTSSAAALGSSILAFVFGAGFVLLAVGGYSSHFVLKFGDGVEEAGNLFSCLQVDLGEVFHVGLIGDVAGTYFFGDDCLFREVGLEANRFRCGFMLNIQVGGLEIRDEVVPRLVIGRTLSPVLACVFNLARLKS